MTIRKPGAALAASLLLAACLFNSPRPGNNQHAGGTIETTNGIALLPDGKSAARIQILLLEENGWLLKNLQLLLKAYLLLLQKMPAWIRLIFLQN